MPRNNPSPYAHIVAQQHTNLLRRMLIARHFTERRAPVPLSGASVPDLDIAPGEEAMLVGLSEVLAPNDSLVRASRPAGFDPRGGPTEPGALLVHIAGMTVEHHGRVPVLFTESPADPSAPLEKLPFESVNGLDVEAVLAGARRTADAVHAGCGDHLMELDMSEHIDPIEVLAIRMRTAHELDDNALHAIDDDAGRLVRSVMAARAVTTGY